jgi:hypothetical protein
MDEPERVVAVTFSMRDMSRICGIAWVDIDKRQVGIGECIDTKQYNNLESLILQNIISKRPILIPTAHGVDHETQKVKQVLSRCDLSFSELKCVYIFIVIL